MKAKQKRSKKSALSIQKHLKHAFVPHKGNQYRPHLVRLHGITAVLVLALGIQLLYGFFTDGRFEVLGRVTNVTVEELLDDTNAARAESSIGELKINEQLSQAAFLKARDMLANNYWAHTSPSGVTPWKWLGDVGYNYNIAGENLAKNYPTADATVAAWMGSETHRANILNDRYQDVGFAVVDGLLDGRDTTLVVAFYGSPAGQAVAGSEQEKSNLVYAAPVSESGDPVAYFGSALQSLSPATIGVIGLLAVVGIVGVLAHHYRNKLPVAWRRNWRVHHGMYTFTGSIALSIIIIVATGGGQL